MKRCEICDSTENKDTLEEFGIKNPILYWIKIKDENNHICYRCNRCDEEIYDALREFNYYYEEIN